MQASSTVNWSNLILRQIFLLYDTVGWILWCTLFLKSRLLLISSQVAIYVLYIANHLRWNYRGFRGLNGNTKLFFQCNALVQCIRLSYNCKSFPANYSSFLQPRNFSTSKYMVTAVQLDYMESMSCHITPLAIINSFSSWVMHARAHTHTHTHTNVMNKRNYKKTGKHQSKSGMCPVEKYTLVSIHKTSPTYGHNILIMSHAIMYYDTVWGL